MRERLRARARHRQNAFVQIVRSPSRPCTLDLWFLWVDVHFAADDRAVEGDLTRGVGHDQNDPPHPALSADVGVQSRDIAPEKKLERDAMYKMAVHATATTRSSTRSNE